MATKKGKKARGLQGADLIGLSSELRDKLKGRVLVDEEFRQRILANPAEAFRLIGVKLSLKDQQLLLGSADDIRLAGERADSSLKLDLYGMLPLGAGGGTDGARRRRRGPRRGSGRRGGGGRGNG